MFFWWYGGRLHVAHVYVFQRGVLRCVLYEVFLAIFFGELLDLWGEPEGLDFGVGTLALFGNSVQ